MIFTEEGEPGGPNYSVFLRATDGSAAVKLGEGDSGGLSPDGTLVLDATLNPDGIAVLPTGAGSPRVLTQPGLQSYIDPVWFPDGGRVLYEANASGHGEGMWSQDLTGGPPQPIGPENVRYGTDAHPISPDGDWISAVGPDGKVGLYPVAGGAPRPVPGLSAGETPIGWTADGTRLYVYRDGGFPEKVYRVDVKTGARELWRTLSPGDPAGLMTMSYLVPTPDGSAYAYTYHRTLSDLYLVTGVR
jgi:hypothetical protein